MQNIESSLNLTGTLKNTFGFSQFRDGQEEIIRDIINEKPFLS